MTIPRPIRRAALAAMLAIGAVSPAHASDCTLDVAGRAFIQGALDDWDVVSRDFLRMESRVLPWMVFIDGACAWHVAPDTAGDVDLAATLRRADVDVRFAGTPLSVWSAPHSGMVRLPGGGEAPAAPLAFAGSYGGAGAAFFVMALPPVWRQAPHHADDPEAELNALMRAVFAHEVTHTQQVAGLYRRIDALAAAVGAGDDFNDDVIQGRYDTVPAFRAAYEAERDLLFGAAAEPDPARRRALAAQALASARERRARFYAGADSTYGNIEDVFLNMEGVANWAAYRVLLRAAGPTADPADVLRTVRRGGRFWSQDQGLALFLVIDALVPGWQARVLSPDPASVFALLAEAAGEAP